MGNGRPKSSDEQFAEMRVELKWTKWLAAAAFASSTLGQVSSFTPPSAVIDLIGKLL